MQKELAQDSQPYISDRLRRRRGSDLNFHWCRVWCSLFPGRLSAARLTHMHNDLMRSPDDAGLMRSAVTGSSDAHLLWHLHLKHNRRCYRGISINVQHWTYFQIVFKWQEIYLLAQHFRSIATKAATNYCLQWLSVDYFDYRTIIHWKMWKIISSNWLFCLTDGLKPEDSFTAIHDKEKQQILNNNNIFHFALFRQQMEFDHLSWLNWPCFQGK